MLGKLLYQFKGVVKKLLPTFLISGYHLGLAFLAALVYRFPGKKIKVMGVTGTNGKSTVVEMLSRIFEEAGFKVASLSSIRFRILGREEVNDKRMTMPGRSFVQGFLRRAKDQGCSQVILEVTSEGIKQHRHEFIDFDTAVFTNLSPEHIESHGSFEKYRQEKGKLFRATKNIHVLNLDDDNLDFFWRFPAKEKWGYCLKNPNSPSTPSSGPRGKVQIPNKFQSTNSKFQTIKADNVEILADGSKFTVGSSEFKLNLLGEFNICNALAAIAAAQSQGIGLETCKKALEKMEGMPGRMEEVIREPFRVLVDYAFTPNAIQKVYETISQTIKSPDPNSKMICVLGSCGGGRDKWKRPVLGGIAAKYCQEIILTNEDPYDENPQEIIDQVAKGVESISINQLNQHKSVVYKIIDRREAIAKALNLAKDGDTAIITGKGCEPSICLADGKQIPWDDRQVVREEFQKLQKTSGH
ncbi:MAG: UDP-N-acetylmuramyl-tripeptide synthetase [bacterium]|nr:UDP-N-acetylmuramyl-tripeptide synthetase [bacterium]